MLCHETGFLFMRKRRNNNGWIIAEIIVAISVLAVIGASLVLTMRTFGTFNKVQLAKQRCLAAGSAQLDSLTVTGQLINKEDFARLWPDVEMLVEETKGQSDWEGMKLIMITTTTRKPRAGKVSIELGRYFNTAKEQ